MFELTPYLIAYVMLAQVADFATTRFAISKGWAREANPIVAWLITKLGLTGGLLVAKGTIFMLGLLCLTEPVFNWFDFGVWAAMTCAYTYAILHNLSVIREESRH